MDSEKENPASPTTGREEEIPGSSPEGVYPADEDHIFHEDQAPLRVESAKHEEEIVEQQQQQPEDLEQGDMIVEDGDQQFMNMVQITQEDMYEAGFDVEAGFELNHLTEEQLNIVVAISQQRQAKQNEQEHNEEVVIEDGSHHHMVHHEMIENQFEGDGNGPEEEYDGNGQIIDNAMHIILTNDGGVNITSKQKQFYVSPSEIANLNIDLNNLSTENVHQLVQLALPPIKEKAQDSAYNDQAPSTSYHHHHHEQLEAGKSTRSPIIGETVQIRTADGRLQDAVVKYVRGDSEYKIQLMNGEFAYATIDQMLVPQRDRSDHEYQQVAPPVLLRRTDMASVRNAAQKRSANDDLCPPVLKKSYQLAPVVDGPHLVHTPNFCCPICDKKVYQKEPSYIVIRLPACDSCTREKIIVLDEQSS
ncbi:uncharacterized protein CELE_R06F6.12 [Caenorhabditis elegans]|uniref:Uncharacterized protein R06F6.12 n=1 Tax=Caenorhabditis elegans TaxID=6239 RepID=YRMC_CAEEL|nr:Uncharacterized protein CELE_R06F6.12 [Caenorhabditis elegans]Q6BEV5.1 RecName: Full=Uncharacterized protein R06F6.12 [Caenorhabditis elegans]CAH04745.1 Uncharacterized protein CELE_R06F6.12 [Caenorhabditis elegans]|eukprot:NP_001022277.1 Uncharacterized protein CELE_R06F6.12 [Caenorhabditis elegans]